MSEIIDWKCSQKVEFVSVSVMIATRVSQFVACFWFGFVNYGLGLILGADH